MKLSREVRPVTVNGERVGHISLLLTLDMWAAVRDSGLRLETLGVFDTPEQAAAAVESRAEWDRLEARAHALRAQGAAALELAQQFRRH